MVKMLKKIFILGIIFLISFVSAIDADIDCPKKVEVGEEFECVLVVEDYEGEWDVKFELVDGKNTLAEIEDGGWKSAYYYIKKFIDEDDEGNEKKVKLRIVEEFEGEIDGVLKLRRGSKREFFDFGLDVVQGKGDVETEEEEEAVEETNVERKVVEIKDSVEKEETKSVINLNLPEMNNKETIIYESKNEKIKKYSLYGFCLFLIVVIVILLLRR